MFYKRELRAKRKLFIFPLMDMFFILLVFYFMVERGSNEVLRDIGLPKITGYGEAHTLIQVIDEDQFLYLDSSAISAYAKKSSLGAFLQSNRVDSAGLSRRIDRLLTGLETSDIPNHLILVRCPDNLTYRTVREVINMIVGENTGDYKARRRILLSVMAGSYESLGFGRGREEGREYLEIRFGAG